MNKGEGCSRDWLELARRVLRIEIQGLEEVLGNMGEEFEQALHLLAECRGRVVVTGVGKSGLVGRKIAATLSSTGTPAYFLHPVEGVHGDLGLIREGDVAIAISNSGETDELNAIIPTLLSLGVKLIGLTGKPGSSLGRLCHAVINTRVPQEACTLGLAPTASTTATLAVGDALAVGLIEWKSFGQEDFRRFHPGGELGRQLSQEIGKLMHTKDVPWILETAGLKQALQILDKGGLGTVIVLDKDDKLKGILTDGDVRRIFCRGKFDLKESVQGYMTKDPLFVNLEQKGATVLDMMEKNAITVMPAVDKKKVLQGIVHLHDLLGKGKFRFNGMRI